MQIPSSPSSFRDHISLLIILSIFVTSCSGIERSEQERVRQKNCKAENIYRNSKEYCYAILPPLHTPRAPYPWEGHAPRLTKDFFRCKGNPTRVPIVDHADPANPVTCSDCDGRHGLPILRGREGVYPILLDLLNYVQEQTGKRVIVTSGHRCPAHNTYADLSKDNRTSKHQIGAEVDFYVQGMEDTPLAVVELLMGFYQGKEFGAFQRYEKSDVSTKPWMNQEIFIKLQLSHEGRDIDNRHPHPYITLQVRYDREAKERVSYDWKKANLGYAR